YAVHNIIYSALTHPVFFFLSLHDALPIFFLVGVQIRELNAIVVPVEVQVIVEASLADSPPAIQAEAAAIVGAAQRGKGRSLIGRSEEHTSELQSLRQFVCRLLLEENKSNI